MTIALGCHKWSFPKATTPQAARIVRALGFDRMDLGRAADVDFLHLEETVAYLNGTKAETGVRFIDVFPDPGDPPNHPEREMRVLSRKRMAVWFAIAERTGVEGVTLTPGRYWPGRTADEDFRRAAEEMRWAVAEGRKRGLLIRIEPHVQSVTWTPSLAVKMVKEAPGLTLTLDHSHFVFHALPYEHISLMHPYATHWHARQARPGALCCSTDDGSIDFRRIVRNLKQAGYDGTICLEFTAGKWMGSQSVDCVSETIALTRQLREYLAET